MTSRAAVRTVARDRTLEHRNDAETDFPAADFSSYSNQQDDTSPHAYADSYAAALGAADFPRDAAASDRRAAHERLRDAIAAADWNDDPYARLALADAVADGVIPHAAPGQAEWRATYAHALADGAAAETLEHIRQYAAGEKEPDYRDFMRNADFPPAVEYAFADRQAEQFLEQVTNQHPGNQAAGAVAAAAVYRTEQAVAEGQSWTAAAGHLEFTADGLRAGFLPGYAGPQDYRLNPADPAAAFAMLDDVKASLADWAQNNPPLSDDPDYQSNIYRHLAGVAEHLVTAEQFVGHLQTSIEYHDAAERVDHAARAAQELIDTALLATRARAPLAGAAA